MSVDYTIAAIPTMYRGRQYRSRLEARWAAFFDNLGWTAEYEPYDLGAWSPDFLIRATSDLSHSVLVEVKPVTVPDQDTLDQMRDACVKRQLWEGDEPLAGALLVGISPWFANGQSAKVGWFLNSANMGDTADEVEVGWCLHPERPEAIADILRRDRTGWYGALSGDADSGLCHHGLFGEHVMHLWGRATNMVQWHRGAP